MALGKEGKEGKEGRERSAEGSRWSLRLAGPQDDSNEALWAAHSRASGLGSGGLSGLISRNRWLAAGAFLVVLLPAAAWLWTRKPEHRATAQLVVKTASGGAVLPPAAMMAEVQQVRSGPTLRRVAEALDLGDGGLGLEKAVERIEENLRVGSLPESGVITIQYSGPDPVQAADIVNTVASFYVDRAVRLKLAAEAARGESAELRAHAQELERASAELAEFLQRNERVLAGAQRDAALSRPGQLASELKRLDQQLRVEESRLDQALLNGGAGANLARSQDQLAALRRRREQVLEQLRSAEARRSQMERLDARHAELQAAVAAAEENYVLYEAGATRPPPTDDLQVNASLAQRATPETARTEDYERPLLLLLSVLAAACAALGAAVWADPWRKPVSHVADLATATGAPVLMMTEETESNVS